MAKAQGVDLALAKHAETTALELQWEPAIDIILDRTGGRILEEVRRRGVRRLVIDGLNALQIAGAHSERLTVFMTALCNQLRAPETDDPISRELSRLGVVVTVPAGRIDTSRSRTDSEQTLMLRRRMAGGPSALRRSCASGDTRARQTSRGEHS